ncbi:MAG: excinuclease ABC subunit UvrA [Patescibacteria group bacterium]
MPEYIKIKGARVNNLKNIDLNIPLNKFVVVSGLSGSGKSSLVFDLIYAESQRRYVESLSSYARQFVGMMDKPDVDSVEGLIPAISIDQKSVSNNPRSTVGTITEIYDYFRLLYSRIGEVHCSQCGSKMIKKIVKGATKKDIQRIICTKCEHERISFKPIDFSFNSSQGACDSCGGLGYKMEIDPESVLNTNLNISQGAVKPWMHYSFDNQKRLMHEVELLFKKHKIDYNSPLKNLDKRNINLLLNGNSSFSGIIGDLNQRYQETDSNYIRQKIGQYMRTAKCPKCLGKRLNKESLLVTFKGLNISELSDKNIFDLNEFFSLLLQAEEKKKSPNLVLLSITKEILSRTDNIIRVGLPYLSASRSSVTLSGGESQRLRLSHQINSNLVGLLYVLDEPSIGLHPKDNDNLILILKKLREKGNSIIVVEHDSKMILSSDYLIDIGPKAGEYGGRVVFADDIEKMKDAKESLTSDYIYGRKEIEFPDKYRKGSGKSIKILGAKENNLKNIDVEIPLEKLIAVTGVSGSGKSTLIIDILAKSLNKKFYRSKDEPGEHKAIIGAEWIDKIIDIDQAPIGRTPRSNLATYTGIFTNIRDEFSSLEDAKKARLKAAHFSFNLNGGRCEKCQGDGLVKIEMQFLPDIYVKCDACDGKRYKKEVLDIKLKGKNIFEVLEMTVEEAIKFFAYNRKLYEKLKVLSDIGLSYIRLGQSATTLSGGESQRIKLAFELSRPSTGKTLYILDEPTTGLHFDDVKNLLKVLNALVDKGNTVLLIEHNLDVIKSSDWLIDLGPDGGNLGGELIACGTPRDLAKIKKGYTSRYLKEII